MLPLSVHYSGSGEEDDGEMMERGGLDERARQRLSNSGGEKISGGVKGGGH